MRMMYFKALLCLPMLFGMAQDGHAGSCGSEVLAQRRVMHDLLSDTARHGLRGNHHFSITFLTTAKGVKIPADQRVKYPENMSVILQYEFEHLVVHDDGFEVDLFFRAIRRRVAVPFDAVTSFIDPSTDLRLVFPFGSSVVRVAEMPNAEVDRASSQTLLFDKRGSLAEAGVGWWSATEPKSAPAPAR